MSFNEKNGKIQDDSNLNLVCKQLNGRRERQTDDFRPVFNCDNSGEICRFEAFKRSDTHILTLKSRFQE